MTTKRSFDSIFNVNTKLKKRLGAQKRCNQRGIRHIRGARCAGNHHEGQAGAAKGKWKLDKGCGVTLHLLRIKKANRNDPPFLLYG